jgi:hypothetical protein
VSIANDTPVERVQTQAIGTAITVVTATASRMPAGSGNGTCVRISAYE